MVRWTKFMLYMCDLFCHERSTTGDKWKYITDQWSSGSWLMREATNSSPHSQATYLSEPDASMDLMLLVFIPFWQRYALLCYANIFISEHLLIKLIVTWRQQAVSWTNLETSLKIHLPVSSSVWRPLLGFNLLIEPINISSSQLNPDYLHQ